MKKQFTSVYREKMKPSQAAAVTSCGVKASICFFFTALKILISESY